MWVSRPTIPIFKLFNKNFKKIVKMINLYPKVNIMPTWWRIWALKLSQVFRYKISETNWKISFTQVRRTKNNLILTDFKNGPFTSIKILIVQLWFSGDILIHQCSKTLEVLISVFVILNIAILIEIDDFWIRSSISLVKWLKKFSVSRNCVPDNLASGMKLSDL